MTGARRVPAGERDRYLQLLLLADESEAHVRSVVGDGVLFALDDDLGSPLAAVLVVPVPAGEGATAELHLVAVREDAQGRGVGRQLVAQVLDELRTDGVRRVEVGTSNAGIGQLAFYQKCGFRLLRIERDHFDAARGYDGTQTENGIAHRDLVWLDQEL